MKKPKTQDTTTLRDEEWVAIEVTRHRLGYTDLQVALRLHVADSTWKRWRRENRVPTGNIPALARVFDMPELVSRYFDIPSNNHDGSLRREVAELRGLLEEALRKQETG